MYKHKLNINQFNKMVKIKYDYKPKDYILELRQKVELNLMLKKMINNNIDIKKDFNMVLDFLAKLKSSNSDITDYIKLKCYVNEKRLILNELVYCQNVVKKQALEKLFNKYFVMVGDYMLTITLK